VPLGVALPLALSALPVLPVLPVLLTFSWLRAIVETVRQIAQKTRT
jgi:hypothetical protein